MTGPPCHLVGADVVPRYVAGTLESDAVEPFELHMVDCATCQRAIREAAALRKVLRKVQDKVQGTTEGARATPRPMRRRLPWVVPLAAAAAVTAIWLVRPSDAPVERLGRLAGAPALDVLPVRGDPDSVALLVRQGIDAYHAGRYPEAARLFARADSLSPSESATFYRGVSALLGGNAAGAIEVLRRVTSTAGGPYAAEGHFYSAKAWLRQGRADSALVHLATIAAGGGALAAHAAALADSVKAVLR